MQKAHCPTCKSFVDVDAGILCPNPDCPTCKNRKDGNDLIVTDVEDSETYDPSKTSKTPWKQETTIPTLADLHNLRLFAGMRWESLSTSGNSGILLMHKGKNFFVVFSAVFFLCLGFTMLIALLSTHSTAVFFAPVSLFFIVMGIVFLVKSKSIYLTINSKQLIITRGNSSNSKEAYYYNRNSCDKAVVERYARSKEGVITYKLSMSVYNNLPEFDILTGLDADIAHRYAKLINVILNADLKSQEDTDEDSKKCLEFSIEKSSVSNPPQHQSPITQSK